MPIIPVIGRKSTKMRLLIAAIYILLIIGCVTMIYPFLIMLSGSTKGLADMQAMDPVPKWLYSEQMRFARYVEDRYQGNLTLLSTAYSKEILKNEVAPLPVLVDMSAPENANNVWLKKAMAGEISLDDPKIVEKYFKDARDEAKKNNQPFDSAGSRKAEDQLKEYAEKLEFPMDKALAEKYQQFMDKDLNTFPDHFYTLQEFTALNRIVGRNFRAFRDTIKSEVTSIDDFNKQYKNSLANWNEFPIPLDAPLTTEQFNYENNAFVDRFLKFKRACPLTDRAVSNVDGYFVYMQKNYPKIRSGEWQKSLILSERVPTDKTRDVWIEFVQHNLNCNFVKLDPQGMAQFKQYLASRFPGGISEFNRINDTKYASFNDVNATSDELRNSAVFTQYTKFVREVCPPERVIIDSPNTRFRKFIGDSKATMPAVAYDYTVFNKVKKQYLTEIATRNYKNVIDYIVIYGRAITNTIIFIGLSIAAALIVNPLAAYALSRFKLKQTYTILMFFLTTMAFPGAVTMIPNFLLLKNLHLLNTFWALILPGVANGYSIFILKGFFDSIPQEVYESAMIDGAGEWTMFWRFTMALSTPILALIGLNAFTGAYTAFMFALIICPDERMWTLMVWLYQMQIGSAQPVIYAALVLAAIPTLLMFIFAQDTIMKGIVIPVEK